MLSVVFERMEILVVAFVDADEMGIDCESVFGR